MPGWPWCRSGRAVLVHCGGGKGRAGTVLACYLCKHGLDAPAAGVQPPVMSAEAAVSTIRAMRPGSIETEQQRRFVVAYGKLLWRRVQQHEAALAQLAAAAGELQLEGEEEAASGSATGAAGPSGAGAGSTLGEQQVASDDCLLGPGAASSQLTACEEDRLPACGPAGPGGAAAACGPAGPGGGAAAGAPAGPAAGAAGVEGPGGAAGGKEQQTGGGAGDSSTRRHQQGDAPGPSSGLPAARGGESRAARPKQAAGTLPRLLVLVGLPGSGKSWFAQALVASGHGWARVCQDEEGGSRWAPPPACPDRLWTAWR
jgi:hypothetical protein